MTIFEALKGLSAFPVSDDYLEEVIIRRHLTAEDEVTADILSDRPFLLAKADIYTWLFFAPSMSQGGLSFSLTDAQREQYKTWADGIYAELSDEQTGKVTYGYKGTKL